MSYILDALRKSEQERQRGRVPDIQLSNGEDAAVRQGFNYWPAVTVLVVLVNVGILGYFWLSQPKSVPVSASTEDPEPSVVEPPAVRDSVIQEPAPVAAVKAPPPAPSVEKPLEKEPLVTPRPRSEPAPEIIRPTRQQVETSREVETINEFGDNTFDEPVPSVGYLPQLEELPAADRNGVPDMTFSSHMYSSIPRFRSIIINGKRLKEGQFFNEQLQVREITESGVIMSKDGLLFEVDVLGRWAQ